MLLRKTNGLRRLMSCHACPSSSRLSFAADNPQSRASPDFRFAFILCWFLGLKYRHAGGRVRMCDLSESQVVNSASFPGLPT